jgi:hypothetical protein
MEDGMKVIQKYVDMAKYAYVILRNFPRSEKYTLAADIRQRLWGAGALLSRAGSVPGKAEKQRLLEQADMDIAALKFLIRMGMEMEFIPLSKYETFSKQIVEVGKMLGGWLKFVRQ